jgi:hypothetical protein
MPAKRSSRHAKRLQPSRTIAEAILDFVGDTPASSEQRAARPQDRARAIARRATRSAAMTAGSLSLPPGPLGWLTLLPELRSLWKLQAQMVADIAACYGKTAGLGREEMLYLPLPAYRYASGRQSGGQDRPALRRSARVASGNQCDCPQDRVAHLAAPGRPGHLALGFPLSAPSVPVPTLSMTRRRLPKQRSTSSPTSSMSRARR